MPRRAQIDYAVLDALLKGQDRVATHRQLIELGLAAGTFSHRTRPGGPWQRLLPGVVVTHAGRPGGQELARAALLYAGEGSVLTGLEAMRRAGLVVSSDVPHVHVLVPHERRRVSTGFVVVERTHRMPSSRVLGRLPCAPVARAVVDHCRRLTDLDAVRALVAECVQRRACRSADLVREVKEAQRRGTRRPRAALAEVLGGVRSVAEARARALLLAHKIRPAEWNVDLFTLDGRFLAAPDAWWGDVGVALEINSREWHLSPASWQEDQRRWRELVAVGVLVVPVTPAQLRDQPAAFIGQMTSILEVAARRPCPPVHAEMRSQRAS